MLPIYLSFFFFNDTATTEIYTLSLHDALHLPFDVRQRPEVRREHHADHRSVCTSTESTAGRSRTMGVQLSPASGERYTCPPVVPKYTPHLSSESMAIASRSTLT